MGTHMLQLIRSLLLVILLTTSVIAQQVGPHGRGGSSHFRGGLTTLPTLFPSGTVALPGIAFSDASTGAANGFYWIGANNFGLSTNGVKLLDFAANYVESAKPIHLPNGTEGAPALAFNDGAGNYDIGIYHDGFSTLLVSIDGSQKWRFMGDRFGSIVASHSSLVFEPSSATNPNVIPASNDFDTGIGHAAADAISLVAGGVEGMRITEATRIDVAVNGAVNYAADGQGDDDYEVAIPTVTALVAGLTVTFLANTANTGGATLEITSVGDLDAILKQHDVALASNDIEAGQIVVVVFDGTSWQMVSQIAN